MAPFSYQAKLTLIKRAKTGEKVARLCREAGVSRKTFYSWLKKYKKSRPNLAYLTLWDKRYKKKVSLRTLEKEDKLLLINKAQAKQDKVARICKDWGIARKTFYKWLARYKEAGESGLKGRRLSGQDHHNAISEDTKRSIKQYIALNPDLSVHKLNRHLDFVGHHAIQNFLQREDLNTVAKRKLFAQGYISEPEIQVAPLYYPEMPMYRLRQLIAPFVTIPKLARLFTHGQVLLICIIFFAFYLYKILYYTVASPTGTAVGTFFAAISLTFGLFFFIYSLKYYFSAFLVLKFAQSGGPSQSQSQGSNSRVNAVLGKARRLAFRFFGVDLENDGVKRVNPLLVNLQEVVLSAKPFVSIHVALYNEKRVVERLIAACTSQAWFTANSEQLTANSSEQNAVSSKRANYEVVITDDSTDETTEIVKELLSNVEYQVSRTESNEELEVFRFSPPVETALPVVKLIHRFSRAGFKGAALQKALENTDARAEYIAVFDADFVPYPDTIEQFIKSFQEVCGGLDQVKQSNVAAVQGYQWHVLNKSQTWVTRGVRTEYAGSYVIERSGEEIYGGLKQIAGSVYAIRADVLRKFGWGTSITEDFELTLRLYEAGYKVVFSPYIQAPAEAVSTVKRLIRQRMRWAEGASHNIKLMLGRMLVSPHLTRAEKLEFIYLAPYYLQAAFFVVGTFSWFLSEAVLNSRLPFWTVAFGWSLVFTNMLALPLMNIIGLFLEESDERDYVGVLSFILLSYIVVPFQAYAAIKGFMEPAEGPWFRTPKTGAITDVFGRPGFGKFFGNIFGKVTPEDVLAYDSGVLATLLQADSSNLLQARLQTIRLPANLVFAKATSNVGPKKLRLVGRSVLVALLLFAISLNIVSFNQNGFFGKAGQAYVSDDKRIEIAGKDIFKADEKPQFKLKIPEKDKETRLSSLIRKVLTLGEVQAAVPTVSASLVDSMGGVRDVSSDLTGDNDNFKLALAADDKLKPGKYTLEVQAKDAKGHFVASAKQDFRWGVLAINVNNSILYPNEFAKIGFGTLDDGGRTVCSAKLTLQVTTPAGSSTTLSSDNGLIRQSGNCSRNSVTNLADYLAEYKTKDVGTYNLHLTAETENGTRSIDDSFEVRDFVPFAVERTSYPTRIYPPSTYDVSLTVVANEDFIGEVVEEVPSSFEITQSSTVGIQQFSNITAQTDKKVIGWKVTLLKGSKTTFGYTINFPRVSPEFYLVGPLRIYSSGLSLSSPTRSGIHIDDSLDSRLPARNAAHSAAGGRGNDSQEDKNNLVFSEARQWQIASDGFVTSFSNTNKTAGTTLAITVSGVTAGDTFLIAFAMDNATGTISATDDASTPNTYTVDADQDGGGTSATTIRTAIISAYMATVTNLTTITVTHPSVTARSGIASEFSGINQASPFDKKASASGQISAGNKVASSGATATTAQADEVIYGAIGFEKETTDWNVIGTGMTPDQTHINVVGTTGGLGLSNASIEAQYAIQTATNAQTADGTLKTNNVDWSAAVATYKYTVIPEYALALAPLALVVPKIIKSIQKGTLIADVNSLLRKILVILKRVFAKSLPVRIQVKRRKVGAKKKGRRRRKGKRDG